MQVSLAGAFVLKEPRGCFKAWSILSREHASVYLSPPSRKVGAAEPKDFGEMSTSN